MEKSWQQVQSEIKKSLLKYKYDKIDNDLLGLIKYDAERYIDSITKSACIHHGKLFTNNSLAEDPKLVYLGRHIIPFCEYSKILINIVELYASDVSLYIVYGDTQESYYSYKIKDIKDNYRAMALNNESLAIRCYDIFLGKMDPRKN